MISCCFVGSAGIALLDWESQSTPMEASSSDCLPWEVLLQSVRSGWHKVYKYFLHRQREGLQWHAEEEFEGGRWLGHFPYVFRSPLDPWNPHEDRQQW